MKTKDEILDICNQKWQNQASPVDFKPATRVLDVIDHRSRCMVILACEDQNPRVMFVSKEMLD